MLHRINRINRVNRVSRVAGSVDPAHSILTIRDTGDLTATVTTRGPHGLSGSELIIISGGNNLYAQPWMVQSVPTTTTYIIDLYLGDSDGGSWVLQ